MVIIATITEDITKEKEAEELFKEEWIRKLMVATLHNLGVTCPGHCNHQIIQSVGGRHCGTLSRMLNKGTKSIFRTLWKLADLGYVQVLELQADSNDGTQHRRAIQRCYRLTEKGINKAKDFENEFTYKSLL